MTGRADRWPEFVRQVEAIANTPEHGYSALLVVGMRLIDDTVHLNGGASPPILKQPNGAPLNALQLQAWRNAMMASAAEALDRVVDTMLEAQGARERGELQ